MATNKYTKKIDELFNKYGKENHKYLLLGYCYSGDEDGGTDDYFYYGKWYEVEPGDRGPFEDEQLFNDQEVNSENRKDYEDFCELLLKAFGNSYLEDNYESTNCYWHRYYFVTRDYKLFTSVCRCDITGDEEFLFDISTLSEESAEEAEDRQNFDIIKEKIDDCFYYARKIKSEKFKKLAKTEIENLLKELD